MHLRPRVRVRVLRARTADDTCRGRGARGITCHLSTFTSCTTTRKLRQGLRHSLGEGRRAPFFSRDPPTVTPVIRCDGPGRPDLMNAHSDGTDRVTRCDVETRLIIPPPRSPPWVRTCRPACRISGPRRLNIRTRVARRPYLRLERN